jgi:hypothetical protein
MTTNTEKLIEALQLLSQSIDSVDGVANAAIFEAAQRLDELQTALQRAHASLVLERNARDEACAEVERVKANLERLNQELYEAKGWRQDWRPEWVRKDPSRLEIAALLLANYRAYEGPTMALKRADALIAAAKEAK